MTLENNEHYQKKKKKKKKTTFGQFRLNSKTNIYINDTEVKYGKTVYGRHRTLTADVLEINWFWKKWTESNEYSPNL